MKRYFIYTVFVLLTSVVVLAQNNVTSRDRFTIEGTVVVKGTNIPVEAELTFCHQTGNDRARSTAQRCYTDNNGKFSLVLPERPNKEAGNYALLVISVKDGVNSFTGEPCKKESLLYVTHFVPIALPDSGNVCRMPVIEMERVVYGNPEWPFELPVKQNISREDSIQRANFLTKITKDHLYL